MAQGKQNLRGACSKDNMKFKFLSSPEFHYYYFIITFHVPNTLVSLSPLPLLVPFHFELSLAFFLVQPFDYSTVLVPAVEHFDVGK